MPGICRTLAAWALVLAGVPAVAGAEEPVLKTAAELRRLTPGEAAQELPARIRGVVTYVRGEKYREFVLQDDTGGLIAHLDAPVAGRVAVGQEVEVEGYSHTQPPTPRVMVRRLTAGALRGLTKALPVTLGELVDGRHECLFVEFHGVIRQARVEESIEPPRLVLDFGSADRRMGVWVSYFDEAMLRKLKPDTVVTLRGVCMNWKSASFQPFSTFVVVNDPAHIEVVSAAPEDLMKLPERPLRELLSEPVEEGLARRVRVRGVVTLNWQDELVVLQNDEGAIAMVPQEGCDAGLGEEVSAAGFPSLREGSLVLEETVFGKGRAMGLPQAEVVTPRRLLAEARGVDRNSKLLRMEGVFKEGLREGRRQVLVVEDRGQTFHAVLPAGEALPAKLRPGGHVELTGVCRMLISDKVRRLGRVPDGFELRLADARGIAVVSSPPWWTAQRLLAAVGLMMGVLLLSVVWGLLLRRKVRERTQLLVREIRARHDAELLAAERMRLAADLHDTLSQSLSGAALQLEVAETLAASGAAAQRAEAHFTLARRLLNRSREDLRRTVWDLNPTVLAEKDLVTALEEVARELTEGGACKVVVGSEGCPERLPERIRVHLFRVGQEALNNALRHGHARQVELLVRHDDDGVMLRVSDDGAGFDPGAAPGPEQGHFGLASLRERLRKLGGTLEICSSAEGTVVLARVPVGVEDEPEI